MSNTAWAIIHMAVGGFSLFGALLPTDGTALSIALSYATFVFFILNMGFAVSFMRKAVRDAWR